MTDTAPDIRSVVLERDLPYPPSRVWRALTTPHLMAEWLMQTDFAPEVGKRFTLVSPHVTVACRVLDLREEAHVSYTWDAMGLESTVRFDLTPIPSGTRLRVEQRGFRPDQTRAFHGARAGWEWFLDGLDRVTRDNA